MKLVIEKDRKVYSAGTWGTKNENNYEILEFEFPAELENYNKRIVYYLDDQRVWDAIVDNKAIITNQITTKGTVKAYVWCTKTDAQYETDVDFRTQLFEMNFFENENADGIVPTPEQVDGFNTMLTAMNAKIDEVDALEQTIGAAEAERQEAEATRVSNENTRESNESTRQTNEQTRQTQEADRERRTDEAIADIEDKTAEYNANAEAKTNEFNQNATQKTNEFNSNYTQKVNDFNSNATTQKADFNSNASSKTSAFNSNAETKTNAFNTNATNKTNDFNSNATEKTTTFNNNASTKTSEFNSNAESKTSTFNDNATQKTTNFDNNATEKTNEFNTNAQNKIDEYDEHTEELQEEIDELSANMPWNTTEQVTETQVTDAAKYSKNKLELFGNTEQDNTKMTYKCDGTETGDYYLTYNSIDYYFTMPTIVDGDILVFNTTELKLYLADTEITTESTGTGTKLTFISSPSPNYPQDIHVVTGENTIGVQENNLFDKDKVTIYGGYFSAAGVINGKTINDSPDKWFYISCKPNTTYKITKPVTPVLSNNRFRIGTTASIPNNNSKLDDFWMEPNGSTVTQHVITTSNNAKYLCIYYGCNPNAWNDKILAVLGGLIISYFSSYPINLGLLELCKIGNYQDKIFKNESNNQHYDSSLVENAWYEYKKVAKYTVTEKTGLYYPSANHVYIRTGESYIRSSASLGSYYLFENRASEFGSMTNWHFGLEGTGVIHLKDNRFNSPGEFTDYFREHPLVIYLPYTTAKNIQITDETLIAQLDELYEHLKLVKGTNNITVTAEDITPYMQLSYMQDLPAKLDKLDSRLALLE